MTSNSLASCVVVHQARLREAAIRQAAMLGERDQLLDVGPKLLRLGDGGGDLFVLDERGRHVAEQGRAVARGALKLTAANTMAHRSFPSFVWGPYQVSPARRWFGAAPSPLNGSGEHLARRTAALKRSSLRKSSFVGQPIGAQAGCGDEPEHCPRAGKRRGRRPPRCAERRRRSFASERPTGGP